VGAVVEYFAIHMDIVKSANKERTVSLAVDHLLSGRAQADDQRWRC